MRNTHKEQMFSACRPTTNIRHGVGLHLAMPAGVLVSAPWRRPTLYRRHKFGISPGALFAEPRLSPSQIKEAADNRGNDGPERVVLRLVNVLAASRRP
jgi:hypothetical protein